MHNKPLTCVILPDWMETPTVKRVFEALAVSGTSSRFVGGCVRDMLLGLEGSDIDIATVLFPEEVTELLEKADIKAVPTGIAHGTVTAICNGQPFEITTLRKDTLCDGRHADVAFTDNWEEDAARRDFTINAMSCSINGELYDYFNGKEDLDEHRVRFVGDPYQRVQEDYLRILRFFRFTTWFGEGMIDPEGLEACSAHKESIGTLSGERIWQEFSKLLLAPDPIYSLTVMEQRGIIKAILGMDVSQHNITHLTTLCSIEEAPHESVLRLAALLDGVTHDAQAIRERLKCSNAQTDMLRLLLAPENQLSATLDERAQKSAIRKYGKEDFIRLLALAWSRDPANKPIFQNMHEHTQQWEVPEFPLSGKDIIALGVEPGETIGLLLSKAEAFWEESDYALNREILLAWVKEQL